MGERRRRKKVMGDLWCLHTMEPLQEKAAAENQIKQLAAKIRGLR